MKNSNYESLIQYISGNEDKFYRLAYSYAGNKDSALDIVQNAVCRALEHHGSIRDMGAVKTWFYRVLVNESLTYLKKNQHEIACDISEMQEPVYYEAAYEPEGDIYEKVNLLSPEIQSVIKLHFYEEMTLKEIAEITATNLNTVKSRLYSGLKQLRIQTEEAAL